MIGIVDYGMGNLGSIANMLKKVGVSAKVSSDPDVLAQADKLILPGIGGFDGGMRNLTERNLIPLLKDKVVNKKTPILGVCLGMQLMTQSSEEGQLAGLGWFNAQTRRFSFNELHAHLKVPHMGWNTLQICQPHPLLAALDEEPRFYFVHSYHVVCDNAQDILAQSSYGYDFVSVIAKDNVLGVQFHPEKSHRFGMKLYKSFAGLSG